MRSADSAESAGRPDFKRVSTSWEFPVVAAFRIPPRRTAEPEAVLHELIDHIRDVLHDVGLAVDSVDDDARLGPGVEVVFRAPEEPSISRSTLRPGSRRPERRRKRSDERFLPSRAHDQRAGDLVVQRLPVLVEDDPQEAQARDDHRRKQPSARTIAVSQLISAPSRSTTFRPHTRPPIVVPFSFHISAP
jgi:hypothetical protein